MSLTYELADEPKILSTFVAGRYKEKENLQENLSKTTWYLPACLCFESTKVSLLESHVMRQLWWEMEPKALRDLPCWVHCENGVLIKAEAQPLSSLALYLCCCMTWYLGQMQDLVSRTQARTFLIIRSYHSVHGNYVQGKLQQYKHTTADHQICGQSATWQQTD